jgi:hypothetical protein
MPGATRLSSAKAEQRLCHSRNTNIPQLLPFCHGYWALLVP